MLENIDNSEGVGLTLEVFKNVFQVVRSDRKRFSKLFDFIDSSHLHDDEVFYTALLDKVRSDPDYCRKLHKTFFSTGRPKDRDRSIGNRAFKWLCEQVPEIDDVVKFQSFIETGEMTALQRDVRDIYFMATDAAPTENEASSIGAVEAEIKEQRNAFAILQEINEELKALNALDGEHAPELLGLAHDLLDAIRRERAIKEARASEAVERRREVLLQDLVGIEVFDEGGRILARISDCGAASSLDHIASKCSLLIPFLSKLRDAQAEMSEAEKHEEDIRYDKSRSRAELRDAGARAEQAEEAETVARGKLLDELTAVAAALDEAGPEAGRDDLARLNTNEREDRRVEEPQAPESSHHNPSEGIAGAMVDENDLTVCNEPESAILTFEDCIADEASDEDHRVNEPAPKAAELDGFGENIDRLVEFRANSADIENTDTATTTAEDDAPAVWTGSKTLEELVARYLDDGEAALAWHLTILAEERGFPVPVPSPVLKALAVAPAIAGPYNHSTQAVGEILAEAAAALDTERVEEVSMGGWARSLAFASLLRPALMARDTNAREHLANLSMADGLSGYARLANTLAGLRHDLQPGVTELNDLVGVEQKRRLPEVTFEIEGWLPKARQAQFSHAPSTTVLHNLLTPTSRLGGLFEATTKQSLRTIESEIEFLHDLRSTRSVAEELVRHEERRMGRPRRDQIKGMGLDWICRWLSDGAELLLRWQEALSEDAQVSDHRKEELRRVVNNLTKELRAVQAGNSGAEGMDGAVQRCVDRAVDDLLSAIEGQQDTASLPRVSTSLRWPLMRLRGPSQSLGWEHALDESADGVFAAEFLARRNTRFEALLRPENVASDELLALEWHIEDMAILPALRLIERNEGIGAIQPAQAGVFRQRIEEMRHAAERRAREEIAALRHALEPLQSLDLSTSQEIQIWLDRFAEITSALDSKHPDGINLPMQNDERSAAVPLDFPFLWPQLDSARELRDVVRKRIMADQLLRLNELANRFDEKGEAGLAGETRVIAASLEDRDAISVEDIIVRLQGGQALSLQREEGEDHFADFYPTFVSQFSSAAPDVAKINQAIGTGGQVGPLDYSRLEDGAARDRSLQLLENWRRLANAMKASRSDTITTLAQFMERLGFTSVKMEQEKSLTPKLRSTRMLADVPSATHWFLPPVFGSGSGGSYPIFLSHRDVEDAQLVSELAKIGRDAPCILLIFDRMTRSRREGFALAMRKAKQTVLLIDETLLHYLSANTAWMERLFACASPFGYLQPYTTSAGNIPSEMFFGRENEIAAIESTENAGCLVYGGRQLGKSALLHHVRKRFDQPDTGRRAYYLKIDEFGGPVQPAFQIWQEIRRVLVHEQILPKSVEQPADIAKAIEDWLSREGHRRILLLVDEADMFLASEAREQFPNLNRLKDLMEASERRFKIVFAGLHNVRRLSKAPNSPLVHLGKPICIGPLNTSAESSHQARRLVVEPMKSAGFDYVSPDLVHALLTRVNYYPSLVQVFCKALLEGISNQTRPAGAGPRWKLERQQLFESSSAEDINFQIRERFQWTLNLDPRYELIAKVIALHRLTRSETEGGGAMTAKNIKAEAEQYWPREFEKLQSDDFRAFLDEMVDLGVLICHGDRRHYSLRGAQVAQMLGQREQLEDEILKIAEKEPRVDYDPGHYHRRVRLDNAEVRAPLADGALSTLFDPSKPGVRFLVANAAMWGKDLVQVLSGIARDWDTEVGRLKGVAFSGDDDDLRRTVERGPVPMVIVFPAAGRISASWLNWLRKHLRVIEGKVLPIVVGELEQIATLLPTGPEEGDFGIFHTHAWERTMVRAWLAENGLSTLDTPECRKAILDVTGGVPAFMPRLRPKLEALVAQVRWTEHEARIRELASEFSLNVSASGLPDKLVPMFCSAAELLEAGTEALHSELIELLESDGNTNVDEALRRMTELGLFSCPEEGTISLTHLGSLLARSANAPTVRQG